MKDILRSLQRGDSLSLEQSRAAFRRVIDGAPDCQVAALLSLLSLKGETSEEIAGLAQVLREEMVEVEAEAPLLDIVGTGGDGAHTVNLSTAAALVAASCGARVAKHGNRSVSSQCGSADVVQHMGLPLHAQPAAVSAALELKGFSFLFAQHFHPALAKLAPLRANLGLRSCFNLVGPLLNPARAQYAVIGVYAPNLVPVIAEALMLMGIERAFVFHSCGTDEITAMGSAEGLLVEQGQLLPMTVQPGDYGIPTCSLEQLKGGSAHENAAILMRAFFGQQGAVLDSVALAAGVSLYVAGHTATIAAGVDLSCESMLTGAAGAYVEGLRS